MCMGLPGSPSHRAHTGQGSPMAAGSSPAASPAKHPSPAAGWPGSWERTPPGTSGDEISHGQMQMHAAGLRGEGRAGGGCGHTEPDRSRHREARGTSMGERTRDTKSVYRIRMQSFSLSPRTPQLPTNLELLGGCRPSPSLGLGLAWQGHGSWPGSALWPKPRRGVRRCLGSCDASAKGDPLMQPPSHKLDPALEGLNLSLSSLRNHFQVGRNTCPKQSPVRGIRTNPATTPLQPGSGAGITAAGEILLGQILSTR